MIPLNLPTYQFRYTEEGDKTFIFDRIRRKFVFLSPEEWVRQNFINYLIAEKGYPVSLISVEREIKLNRLSKRCDAVVFSRTGQPVMIAEFKSPSVTIGQATFDQVVRYNLSLRVRYLMISNGLNHFCCAVDYDKNDYLFLKEIPSYTGLQS